MKHLYRCILYLLLLSLVVVFGSVLFWGNEPLLRWAAGIVGIADSQAALQSVLSLFSLPIVSSLLCVAIIIVLVGLYKQDFVLHSLQAFFRTWVNAFRNLFSSLKSVEIVCVLAIPFAASIYFGNVIAVSYDEAITYNLFTIKPFYYCMIFYPYPNNHVLHSLLTNITEYTPFVSTLFSIRIPAIMSSLLAWLIGYSFLKKYYSSRVAIIVVALASVCYLSIYYSFMSRGYAFIVLAFIVCLYAAFNIIHKGSRRKDWMFFVVSGVLGCYAIPSFLYPFATLNVLILIYNYKHIKHQIWANFIAGLFILLAYLPIILVDGSAALTSNQFVQHINRLDILQGISAFYLVMFADIVGVPVWLDVLIVIPFVVTVIQKDKWHLSLWVIFLLAPFILVMLHAVNPFYRTFLYYNFVIFFLMTVPFRTYLERVPKYIIILLLLVVQLIGVYTFDSKIRIKEGFNTDAAQVSEKFFKEGQTIVFPCIASANYEFEAHVRGLSNSIDFLNEEQANADTINNYDYVILEVGRDRTVNKKPFYSTSRQNIYKNVE